MIWPTKEIYEAHQERNRVWSVLISRLPYNPPSELTIENIFEIAILCNIDLTEKT